MFFDYQPLYRQFIFKKGGSKRYSKDQTLVETGQIKSNMFDHQHFPHLNIIITTETLIRTVCFLSHFFYSTFPLGKKKIDLRAISANQR